MEANTRHTPHLGRNIERIRRMKGIKQEVLAKHIGISRQALSRLEQSEEIEDNKLEQVAIALGITSDEIKEFNDEFPVFNIQNMHDNSQAIYQNNINPLEKYVEAVEENKRLYEALLKSEREKIEMLQKMLEDKKTS